MFAGLNILSVSCLCTATGITRGLQKWCCISSSKTPLLCSQFSGKIAQKSSNAMCFMQLFNIQLKHLDCRFQIYCGFSGQVMIDQIYLMLFNMFFTSWTPVKQPCLMTIKCISNRNILIVHCWHV